MKRIRDGSAKIAHEGGRKCGNKNVRKKTFEVIKEMIHEIIRKYFD